MTAPVHSHPLLLFILLLPSPMSPPPPPLLLIVFLLTCWKETGGKGWEKGVLENRKVKDMTENTARLIMWNCDWQRKRYWTPERKTTITMLTCVTLTSMMWLLLYHMLSALNKRRQNCLVPLSCIPSRQQGAPFLCLSCPLPLILDLLLDLLLSSHSALPVIHPLAFHSSYSH